MQPDTESTHLSTNDSDNSKQRVSLKLPALELVSPMALFTSQTFFRLSAISPLALALFAGTLAGMNQNSLSYRIGKLAKRLLSTRQSQRFSSYVTLVTAACVDWMVEPLQCVAESLLNGHKNGLQVGDMICARVSRKPHLVRILLVRSHHKEDSTSVLLPDPKTNYRHYIVNAYLGGQELNLCRDQLVESAESSKQNNLYGFLHEVLCYRMSVSLIEGINFADSFPSWSDLSSLRGQNRDTSTAFRSHSYMRSFLFQSYDDDGLLEGDGLLSRLQAEKSPLRPLFMIGVSLA